MIGAGVRILVVGAGIGGLGAARALRQRGFAADVVEADLHEVLASHGDPLPVRMRVSPQGLSQQDGTATVEFDEGSAGRYDLVIGADGIHSTVRQLAVGAGAVRPLGQLAWRFVTECPGGLPSS
jgi:2-polyprenyl-6-methoxyphenol hydroxylase-like FAD-dependent oxidoreductase